MSQELGSTSSNSSSYHVRVHVSHWYVCVSSVYELFFLNYLQVRVFLLDASHRPWHMQD